MKTSIKDIAQALNLSKATISWILSGQGESKGFNKETIRLVKQYAIDVNYRPNLLARSLSTGITHTLGLIVPSIGDSFFAQMTQAIEIEAEKHNYVLIICGSRGDGRFENQLIQTLRAKQVDGLVIVPSEKTLSGINNLLQDNFPFVLIDRYFPQLKTNYVVVDDTTGCYRLAQSLIRRGCRKIAYITTDVHLRVMTLRLDGYTNALKDNNILFDENLYIEIENNNNHTEINEKVEALLNNVSDIDGILFSTHYLAVEVIGYFIRKKISYQTKFKIASFHTNSALEMLVPDIAVARIPIEEMGIAAVGTLLGNIKEPDIAKSEIVLNTIYERL